MLGKFREDRQAPLRRCSRLATIYDPRRSVDGTRTEAPSPSTLPQAAARRAGTGLAGRRRPSGENRRGCTPPPGEESTAADKLSTGRIDRPPDSLGLSFVKLVGMTGFEPTSAKA